MSKITRAKWTEEELTTLKNNYPLYTNEELQALFFNNRTIRSIECMAGKLGINHAKNYCNQSSGRKWSDEQKQNMSEIKKEYYETHDVWSKGATFSEESRHKMSVAKKNVGKWKGETNPRHITPLNGELNGRWKGGAVDLYRELRTEVKDWQTQSMQICNYHCVITNQDFDNVHHVYPYNKILDETFDTLKIPRLKTVSDYTKEDFMLIRQKMSELHDSYGCGACMGKKVHKLFHDIYGYMNVDYNNFLDFCYRIDIGEFDNWFSENGLEINLNYNYIDYIEKISFKEELAA